MVKIQRGVLLFLVVAVLMFFGVAAASPSNGDSQAGKNLIESLSADPNVSTFVSALKAAGLESTLEQAGPLTVFAPSNEAFREQPKGMMENLMKPENAAQLRKLISYHIIAGRLSTDDLKKKIADGQGHAELTTLQGGKLQISTHMGMHILLKSEDGDMGMSSSPDVNASNGVIHVIDNVMSPKGQ